MSKLPLCITSIQQMTAALTLACLASLTHASCGSAFCTLMTDRYAQGTGESHLGWSGDVRLEAVTQTQLRSGTSNLDASQVTGEEAIERRTRNQNVVTTLGYGIDSDWSVSLRIPVVKRDHLHHLIDEDTGLPSTPEQWRFKKLGDVQVLARRQLPVEDESPAWALFAGLKLPTGSTQVRNGDGARAERALQPGSGTTDLVLGLAGRQGMGLSDALIGQASVSQALNSREDFKPGTRIELSAGWSHAVRAGQFRIDHGRPEPGRHHRGRPVVHAVRLPAVAGLPEGQRHPVGATSCPGRRLHGRLLMPLCAA